MTITIQERCPHCHSIWERPAPVDTPADIITALGLDRIERLTTPAGLCQGCTNNE